MERPRNSSVFNYHNTNASKRKSKVISSSLPKESLTDLEDLSNEIIYEIFEFLDLFHVYQSFFDLNIRFRKLITCSNLPIKINISSISKSNLQHYYTNIITPYQHRIASLCITNTLCFDLNISPHHILSRFTRLETLILENIQLEHVKNIFKDISSLSNLSTLVIIRLGSIKPVDQYLLYIFRLSALKYCKILFYSLCNHHLLPFATNEYSSIEQFIIKDEIHIGDLVRLLSYVPQLRRLSLVLGRSLRESQYELNHPTTLNHLTHLSLKLDRLGFNDFVLLIKKFFSKVQVLHLSVTGNEEYVDANRWEELILSSLPFLHVFDIYAKICVRRSFISRLNEFSSLFWVERHWFFAHQGYYSRNYYTTTFYSISPYRQKEYILERKLYQHTGYTETNLTSIRHVRIMSERAIYHHKHHFPNATNLTFENCSSVKLHRFIPILKQIIPLQNLTKLDIKSYNYSLEKLIELLSLTPNIVTLEIARLNVNEKDLTIENSENFQLVCNVNIIRNVVVVQINEVEEVKLLFRLCPRIQYFTIVKHHKDALAIVRLMLSEYITIGQHLILSSIGIQGKRRLDKLNELIQARKCLHNCFIKVEKCRVYLWW